jgi:hypothetical protein
MSIKNITQWFFVNKKEKQIIFNFFFNFWRHLRNQGTSDPRCLVMPRYMRNKKKVAELFCPWLDAAYWLPLPWIPILQLQPRTKLFCLWLDASHWLPMWSITTTAIVKLHCEYTWSSLPPFLWAAHARRVERRWISTIFWKGRWLSGGWTGAKSWDFRWCGFASCS